MRGELDSPPLGYLTLLLGVWLFRSVLVFVRECVCVWVPAPALPLEGGAHAYVLLSQGRLTPLFLVSFTTA
jgi:hypothetical protein